jgi:PQQ-dependent catabolism-associated beta-propeller protein
MLALLLCAAATVYVSNEASNVVHVVDAATGERRADIPVGRRPRGLTLSPDGKSLYVAVSEDNRIDVVDLASGKVARSLPSGPDPELIAVAPDGRTIYVANEEDALVSFLDVATAKVTHEVPVGIEPEGMAVSPDGRTVIATSETTNMAHLIAAADATVTDNLPVDTRPRYAAFTPDGRQFWVSSEMRGTVTVFEAASRKLLGKIDFAPLAEQVQPVGIAFTQDGQRAFVALGRGNMVAEVAVATREIGRSFTVGQRAWHIALSRDEQRLYTANGLSGDMSIVEIASGSVRSVALGGRPWGVTVSP